MFRKTAISLTLAALTTVATISAAPALAAPVDEGLVESAEIAGALIDFTDIVSATMDESPTESDDLVDDSLCFIEDDESWMPCIDLGSLLGFPSVDESETDEPLTPGGIVTDAPIDVVESEGVFIDPALIPDISDILDFPSASDTDDSETTEGDGLVGVVERSDLADALREAGIGTIEDSADGVAVSEPTDAAPVTEGPARSVEEPTESTVSSDVTGGSETTATAASERIIENNAAGIATTTMPIIQDADGDQTVLAAIDPSTPSNANQGIDPLLGALFGALAGLALAVSGIAAFKLGRRGA